MPGCICGHPPLRGCVRGGSTCHSAALASSVVLQRACTTQEPIPNTFGLKCALLACRVTSVGKFARVWPNLAWHYVTMARIWPNWCDFGRHWPNLGLISICAELPQMWPASWPSFAAGHIWSTSGHVWLNRTKFDRIEQVEDDVPSYGRAGTHYAYPQFGPRMAESGTHVAHFGPGSVEFGCIRDSFRRNRVGVAAGMPQSERVVSVGQLLGMNHTASKAGLELGSKAASFAKRQIQCPS